jgi:hypothetical protein
MFNITDFGGLNYHKKTRLSRQKMNPHSVNLSAIMGLGVQGFKGSRVKSFGIYQEFEPLIREF